MHFVSFPQYLGFISHCISLLTQFPCHSVLMWATLSLGVHCSHHPERTHGTVGQVPRRKRKGHASTAMLQSQGGCVWTWTCHMTFWSLLFQLAPQAWSSYYAGVTGTHSCVCYSCATGSLGQYLGCFAVQCMSPPSHSNYGAGESQEARMFWSSLRSQSAVFSQGESL
jgi:hypothetical protein